LCTAERLVSNARRQFDKHLIAAALACATPTDRGERDTAHALSHVRVEGEALGWSARSPLGEFEEALVDQHRGTELQRLTSAPQAPPGEPLQLLVHQREQAVSSGAVTGISLTQELRNVTQPCGPLSSRTI